eukprot:Phypoly_transcript_07106.p1 GENE.Phypoly_transcript_07106~~Phypoly_transcript_07106.p1  ORF type:complete len:373 (+),score=32.31 Phypoly_transcript_07106:451-1569(+)
MIAIFTLILNSDHIIVGLFVIGLQILVFREILNVRYNVVKEKALIGFRSLNWFFLWSSLFFLYGKPVLMFLAMKFSSVKSLVRYHIGVSFALYVIGFVTFILTLRRGYYKYQITQMTWTLMILMIIVVQSTFIVRNIFEGLIWFLLPCSIIICNDIFAYFSGFFFGKKFINKPFLRISPNKTWEGFIGATFWTLLFGFYFAGFLAQSQWFICPRAETDAFKPLHCSPDPVFLPKNYSFPDEISLFLSTKLGWNLQYVTLRPIQLHSLVLGLFGSLIAPFGGFFASAIKRAYRIKDFDTIFPGHGGFTDRTDCQYIMGVFTYVYYAMFIRSHVLDVEAIFDSILLLSLPEQQVLLNRLNDTVTSAIAESVAYT